jgi:membrane-associated phospholipid phosphatase
MSNAEATKALSIEDRPWRRATGWLVLLATFFYLSYGLSNWLASQRTEVPVIVFAWERAIPFLTWTIVPYWSTHVFFALSFYVCRNRVELDSHSKRLLMAQVIAVACFIVFPLRVSFARPQVAGAFELLFDALRMLDLPFNQAPSLHVATMTILFDLYMRALPRWSLPAFAVWSLIVIGSVMTTYQHHFIDVPTGFLLGLVCVWMWPRQGGNRLAQLTRDRVYSMDG